MSLLGDVQEALVIAPIRGDGCKICEPWYEEAHRPSCPFGLLFRTVAPLKAAERSISPKTGTTYDGKSWAKCRECHVVGWGDAPIYHHDTCTTGALVAALKEPA